MEGNRQGRRVLTIKHTSQKWMRQIRTHMTELANLTNLTQHKHYRHESKHTLTEPNIEITSASSRIAEKKLYDASS